MTLPISRDRAWELVKKYNQDKSDLNHYLESEAVMRALAKHFGEDQEYWGMLGLLHDLDWGITKHNMQEHLTEAPEILSAAGFDSDFIETIVSHGYGFDVADLKDKERTEKIQFALACAETVTGLIHAYALMRENKIDGMEVSGLRKKFKDKKFAAGVDREIIQECEQIGLSTEEFFALSINAIKDIAKEVDLA